MIEYNRHFQYLCLQSMAGAIKPVVATRGSLKKVAATHRLIEGGKCKFGVNICTPWSSKHDDESQSMLRCYKSLSNLPAQS